MNTLVFDSSKIRVVSSPKIVGLPKGFTVEYFGLTSDRCTFIIFRPEQEWDYTDFVCLVNGYRMNSHFINVNARKVLRYRDGGTTELDTDIGHFVFPTPLKPELKPTLDGKEVILYD